MVLFKIVSPLILGFVFVESASFLKLQRFRVQQLLLLSVLKYISRAFWYMLSVFRYISIVRIPCQ